MSSTRQKAELKMKLVSLLVIAIMLCAIFPGAVTAENKKRESLSDPPPNTGNTGYEPWYYYAAGGIVNTANGNVYFAEKDILIKARGFDIEIIRSYNSHNSGKYGPFGFGWTFNYNIYLIKNKDGSVTYRDEDGSAHTFTPAGGGKYNAPPGMHSKLVKNPDGSFTLWFTDGSKYNFGSNGKINNIIDKNGNHLNFEYNILGRLTRVSDDSGLYLDITYNWRGRINSVADPLGREIKYEYEVADLIKVIDAMENSSLYEYYDSHKLKSKVDRVDSMLIFSYYDDGKVKDVKVSKYGEKDVIPFTIYKLEYASNTASVTDALGHKTTIEHNSNGNPVKITDPLGGVTTMQWDSDMNIVSTTDANGHTTSFNYDAFGNLIKETDALGNSILYEYNNIDSDAKYISLLVNTTNARGFKTSFAHDAKGNLIRHTDATGNHSSMGYDIFGNKISSTDFRGYTTFFTYDTYGYLLNSTDATGNVTSYSYDSVGRLLSENDANGYSTKYEYDANDNLLKEIDATGNETKYEYNAEGTLINTVNANGYSTDVSKNIIGKTDGTTDASGNETSFEYDKNGNLIETTDANDGKTKTTYDALGRVISVTDALGNTVKYTYDAAGRVTSIADENGHTTHYTYDAVNKLIQVKDPLGHATHYSYSENGNLLSFTDENGRSNRYEYDALDRVTRVIDALGNEEVYSYDENGNLLSYTDVNMHTTFYEYDSLNRLIKSIDPAEKEGILTYDAVGNLIGLIDRNGHATSFEYDALNRLTKITDALGNTESYGYDAIGNIKSIKNAKGLFTTYSYDKQDRITKTTDATGNSTSYSYDALGNLIGIKDANGNAASFVYDALNRLIKINDALNQQIKYEYDAVGNIVRVTDENKHETRYKYDALDRLTKEINSLDDEITYSYDNVGNLLGITNENGHTTRYEYDPLDRLTKVISPLGYQTKYNYDAAGNIVKRVDANGNPTFYTYDNLNQRTLVTYPDGTNVTYNYDAEGNLIQINDIINNSYDEIDQLVSTTVNYGSFSKIVRYTYDANGNRATMIDPNGGVTSYAYDAVDRLVSITDPSGETATYQYDNVGRRIGIKYPNGVTTAYSYNAADRLLKLVNKKSNGEAISSYTYTYDNFGNRLSMTEANGDVTYYEYDALYRLTKVTNPSGNITRYTYDAAGNRLSEENGSSTIFYTYDADSRLLNANGISYGYDNNGDLISKSDGTKYEYDYENRLTKVTLPDASPVTYQYTDQYIPTNLDIIGPTIYAPTDERLSRTDSSGTTYYFYEIEDILMEFDVNGVQKARYTHGIGIDEPISMDRNGAKLYYHIDGLGSITSLTDVNENIVASYKYDVFGEIREKTGSVVNPYAFTGREYDEDAVLYYYRARYYDAKVGRFLSKDPVTLDLYNYADNNPVNLVDPYGLLFEWVGKAWGGAKKCVGTGWLWTRMGLAGVWGGVESIGMSVKSMAVTTYGVSKVIWTGRIDWELIRRQYEDSALGQAERIGGATYEYTKYSLIIATAAMAAWLLIKAGIAIAKLTSTNGLATLAANEAERKVFIVYATCVAAVLISVGKYWIDVLGGKRKLEESMCRAGCMMLGRNIQACFTGAAIGLGISPGAIGKIAHMTVTWLTAAKVGGITAAAIGTYYGSGKLAEYLEKKCVDSFCLGEGESTKGIKGFKKRDTDKKPERMKNEHPDDNYDVSILSYSSNTSTFNYKSEEVAILVNGYYEEFSNLLAELGESTTFVDIDTPLEELNDYQILIIPSAGFFGIDSLSSFKSKLDQYVSDGGTLIVYSQQHGYEFNAVPGDLSGYGWTEDQACHYRSVAINTYHPILSGQDSVTLDVVVDGFFATYPENATILLTRTKNGMPAMLMYEYGNGTVIATTIYTDWAYGHHQATGDGKRLVRDMISWAKEQKEMPDYGSGDSMNIPINVTSYIDLPADKVEFTVINPDNKVVDTVEVTTSVLPYETKTVNFTYTAPSKLGIWHLDYLLVNNSYGEVQLVREAQKFEMSKYVKNPDGFVYRGKELQIWATSTDDYVARGSEVVFTIYVRNDGDKSFNGYINIYGHEQGGAWWAHYHTISNITVPARSISNFTYVHKMDYSTAVYSYLFDDSRRRIGSSERGVWTFYPSVDIDIETDKTEYAKGEDVYLSLNLTNKQSVSHNSTVTVKTLDPDNKKVFEGSINVSLSASASTNKTLSFSLPIDSEYGVFLVTAEAYKGGTKIGSDSTCFEVRKDYTAELSFDKPDKAYNIRQNMRVYLTITNVGLALWNSTVNLSIPDLAFEDSKSVVLNPTETEKISHNLSIPENLTAGKHDVIVTVETDNATIKDCFVIPESKLVLSSERSSYNAGENVYYNLSNSGGVDTAGDYSVKLRDRRSTAIYEGSGKVTLLAGETKPLNFTIPNGAVSGEYYLLADSHDLSTDKRTSLSKRLSILDGIEASLGSRTEKKVYTTSEEVSILSEITNLDGKITNATLNLRIFTGIGTGDNSGLGYGTELYFYTPMTTYINVFAAEPGTNVTLYYDGAEKDNFIISSAGHLKQFRDIPGDKNILIVADKPVAAMAYFYCCGWNKYALTVVPAVDTKVAVGRHFYSHSGDFLIISLGDGNNITINHGGGTKQVTLNYEETYYGYFQSWSDSDGRAVEIISTEPVLVIQGGDCYNYGAYLPDVNTGNAMGTEFKGRTGSFILITSSADNNNVTARYLGGDQIGSWTLSQGQHIEVEASGWYSVSSTAPVSVMSASPEGCQAGDDVYTLPSLGEMDYWIWAGSRTYVFAYESDTDLYIDGVYGTTLNKSELYNAGSGVHHIVTDKPVAIIGYSVQGGCSGWYWNDFHTFLPAKGYSEYGEFLWEENISTDVDAGDTAYISTTVGQMNTTGKFTLLATLSSHMDQVIAQDRNTFYVTDKNTSLTLETDKRVYKPGETVVISGMVQNYAAIAKNYTLSIKKERIEIFSDAFLLDPGECYNFTTSTRSNTSFTLEGTVDGVTVTDFVHVETASINVSVIAPDVVGLSPFNTGVLIENVGKIRADLNVSIINNNTWNGTVPEGESRLLETTMSITKNTTLNIMISGDVNQTIQKDLYFGENTRITITPEDSYLEGTVEIPFILENTGLLDSAFNAAFSIANQTISEKFFVPNGENISGSVSFNLTVRAHLLRFVSPFETVNVTINVLSPPEFVVTSIYPEDMNFTIGQNVSLVFEVENTGGREEEAALRLEMPDFEDTNRTWVKPGAKENISFNFTIPDDLEEKSYKGIYELDGEREDFTFFVQGANISVDASLDKPLYEEGETAILTLTVNNERNRDLRLYSRVKFNGYDTVTQFNLTGLGTKTLTFSIPVSFTGDNKMLYTVYMDTGRSLYINSIYVYEKKPDVPLRLYTDKDVYTMGEDVTIHIIDVTGTEVLNLTAPNFSYDNTISGPTTLKFTLPELRSGTYYSDYRFGNFSSSHPFDVIGYSARILEASLDKEKYYNEDTIRLDIHIEANRNVSGLLRTWIYNPEDELIDEFEMNETLVEGENEMEISRTLLTNISGMHVIVYGFYADLSDHRLIPLASGVEYFDVEEPMVQITVYKGWNMISLPFQPLNISASSVLLTIPDTAGDLFYTWSANKNAYEPVYGLMELELGRAYLIPIASNGIWIPEGIEVHGVEVSLAAGWNMIGLPSATNTSATAIRVTVGEDTYNLVDAIQNGYISGIVYSLNAATEKWDAMEITSPDAVLKPGIGYFAHVNQECTITYP